MVRASGSDQPPAPAIDRVSTATTAIATAQPQALTPQLPSLLISRSTCCTAFFSATYNKSPNVNLLSTSVHRPPPKEHSRPDRTAGYRISRHFCLYCFPYSGSDSVRRFGRVRSAGQAVTNARDARLRSTGPTSYSANAVRLSPSGRKQTSGLR